MSGGWPDSKLVRVGLLVTVALLAALIVAAVAPNHAKADLARCPAAPPALSDDCGGQDSVSGGGSSTLPAGIQISATRKERARAPDIA